MTSRQSLVIRYQHEMEKISSRQMKRLFDIESLDKVSELKNIFIVNTISLARHPLSGIEMSKIFH